MVSAAAILRVMTLSLGVSIAAPTDERPEFRLRWERAVEHIAAGSVPEGFILLDSLRRSVTGLDDSLFSQYVRLVRHCFLPEVPEGDTGRNILITGAAPELGMLAEGDAEVTEGQRMTVIAAADTSRAMPGFAFDRVFTLREQFLLRLPPLQPWQHADRGDLLAYDSCRRLPGGPLLYNPEAQPWKVHLRIVIDCSSTKESIYEYVGNLVIPLYDYIRVKEERRIPNAVSLRCYTQQVFHRRPGTFLGLVAFDRYGYSGNSAAARATSGRKPLRVRYLILVKASQAVETGAELILRKMTEVFKSL
ncbi:MAG: hypothetical protein JW863_10795 [Chitinispirillaceae bacterium]|nr:hypothetical protein [Chitinispirillaceae bacterium]